MLFYSIHRCHVVKNPFRPFRLNFPVVRSPNLFQHRMVRMDVPNDRVEKPPLRFLIHPPNTHLWRRHHRLPLIFVSVCLSGRKKTVHGQKRRLHRGPSISLATKTLSGFCSNSGGAGGGIFLRRLGCPFRGVLASPQFKGGLTAACWPRL